jgi:hypothetical protein
MNIKKIAKAPVNFAKDHKVALGIVVGVAASAVIVRIFESGYQEALGEFMAAEGMTEKFDAFMLEQ